MNEFDHTSHPAQPALPTRRHALLCASAGLLLAFGARANPSVKIGFLVKQPEEAWFQDEWRFAEVAAKEKGFTLVKIGIPNGEKMIAAIDNLGAQKAQGFIICAPDVKLGTAVERAAKRHNMKVMSVDDQLVDGKGQVIASIPHMGISAYEIGKQVGAGLAEEARKRGWKPAETGGLRMAFDQLPTARDRTRGAVDALRDAGFAVAAMVDAPQAKSDTESAFNAANIAFTKHQFKQWLIFGMNDETVLGAVRAAEGRGLKADQVIGIGIGGSRAATNEYAKAGVTGFHGTILISPLRHGYETSMLMYEWITANKAPPALIQTAGMLMTRENQVEVRRKMGL